MPDGSELGRMLFAVQDWARQTFPAPAPGATTCEWCPLCQFMAVLRGEKPELTARVAEAGAAIVSTVKGLSSEPPAPTRPSPRPRVQHVEVDEA